MNTQHVSSENNDTVYIHFEQQSDEADVLARLQKLPLQTRITRRGMSFDSLAPSAIVTGANILVAVIGGLFAYIQSRNGRTIHIKGTDGFEVTVPANTSTEELDRLIKLATERKADRIILACSDDK